MSPFMNTVADQVIAESIDYLVAHWRAKPELEALARRAGYDTTYFQKLFREKVGISPKRLVQYMNMRHVHDLLSGGAATLDAAHAAGLSGTGRLHDLCISVQAATPGEVQRRGEGLLITYGYHPTPLGEILVAQTARGVCYLGFLVEEDRRVPFDRMKKDWPKADFIEDQKATEGAAQKIFSIWNGKKTHRLHLDLYGTNFQIQVWQALLKIPSGAFVSYQDIAKEIKKPKAARAVGGAVGANPVSLLIPCHRVIRQSGIIDNYGWGSPRKKLILAMESFDRSGDLG